MVPASRLQLSSGELDAAMLLDLPLTAYHRNASATSQRALRMTMLPSVSNHWGVDIVSCACVLSNTTMWRVVVQEYLQGADDCFLYSQEI